MLWIVSNESSSAYRCAGCAGMFDVATDELTRVDEHRSAQEIRSWDCGWCVERRKGVLASATRSQSLDDVLGIRAIDAPARATIARLPTRSAGASVACTPP